MSIEIINEVWNYSKAAGTDRLVLLSLADQANDRRECWPSIAYIARRCLVSDRTVQRSIRELERMGEVIVIKGGGGSSTPGGTRSNRYRIVVYIPDEDDDPRQSDTPRQSDGECHPCQGGGDTCVTGGVTPVSPEPSFESSMNRQNSLAPTSLDADERSPLGDAISKACYPNEGTLTSREQAALNTAVKGIFEAGGRAGDVDQVVRAHRAMWPKVALKPTGLFSNWNTLLSWTDPADHSAEPHIEHSWYERIGRTIALTTADPAEARSQIEDELSQNPDFVELAFMAWESRRSELMAVF